MKLILTENQINNLIENSEINSYPELEKFFSMLLNPENEIIKQLGKEKGGIFLQWLKDKDSDVLNKGTNTGAIIHPLNGRGELVSKFGKRFAPKKGASTMHKGIDIAVASNTPVYAAADGTVEFAGEMKGYGGVVIINHDNFKTKYAHLSSWNTESGDQVKQGMNIGYSGGGNRDPHRGTSTGPHLHFEIINETGVAVNPLNYIKTLA
jgi:murein DD-endopeptidase MepM/ murein hydrolase activator NlpD